MSFLSNLLHHSRGPECVLPETHPVVRQMVSVLGFEVPRTADYATRLVPAINSAVEYYDNQVAEIPGPFDVSAMRYAHDPLVHALFPARQEIAHGLGRSIDVKQTLAFLAGADHQDVCALMAVRRRPEAQHPGEPPVLADHTMRSLAATEAGTRRSVRDAAMTRLVTNFGEHLDKLRTKGKLLGEEWNIENRKHFQLSPSEQKKLVFAGEELQPENLLRGLIAWLQRPSEHLQVRVSERRNAGGNHPNPAAEIEQMPQLLCSDRRQWLVCIVRFPTAEGIAAIQNETRQHRYIFI